MLWQYDPTTWTVFEYQDINHDYGWYYGDFVNGLIFTRKYEHFKVQLVSYTTREGAEKAMQQKKARVRQSKLWHQARQNMPMTTRHGAGQATALCLLLGYPIYCGKSKKLAAKRAKGIKTKDRPCNFSGNRIYNMTRGGYFPTKPGMQRRLERLATIVGYGIAFHLLTKMGEIGRFKFRPDKSRIGDLLPGERNMK